MKKLVLLSLLFCFFSIHAQNLTINTAATSAQIVAQLVDPSIVVSNITEDCPVKAARGTFLNVGSLLTLSNGVLITTGSAVTVGTANTDGCQPPVLGANASASTANSANGSNDPDLKKLAGTTINDQCTVSFDMIATSDTLQITYEFGSEEYEGFSAPSTSFNDVFGFFISGPGITVPAGYTGYNFAKIPGTASNVGIKTINQTTNTQYYINNCSTTAVAGITCTLRPANSVEYNGYTKALVAKMALQQGQSYHIKLGVADATDQAYDSGIFIKANSITTAVPIKLLDFSAALDNTSASKRNKIKWKTATENNNHYFEVLRRTDGTPFKAIARVEGNGTSKVVNSYEYIDETPGDGINYYILRQVDFDGKQSSSEAVFVENKISIVVNEIHPNPIGDQFAVSLDVPYGASEAKAEIVDVAGRVVFSKAYTGLKEGSVNEISVNSNDLESGTYLFYLLTGEKRSAPQRIVK